MNCNKWITMRDRFGPIHETCKLHKGHCGPCRSFLNTPGAETVEEVREQAEADLRDDILRHVIVPDSLHPQGI